MRSFQESWWWAGSLVGGCCPSQTPPFSNPSYNSTHHCPPSSTLPYCPRKGRPSPHSLNFRYRSYFPSKTTRARRCVRTLLGWGATPGSRRVGLSLPAPWPGCRAPPRWQRAKGVCVHSRLQGTPAAGGPSPRNVGASWVLPAPGTTRRAMPPRMMAPLGEARHRVFSSHRLWWLKLLSALSPSTRPLPLCLPSASRTPCLPPGPNSIAVTSLGTPAP